ncbi:MAG TPA: hypothetical protein DCY88_25070 [Cyanobacteria bacterium UBA11372]|nr:hypothetical protein [Cyanobacteria bacterium UBA11372]
MLLAHQGVPHAPAFPLHFEIKVQDLRIDPPQPPNALGGFIPISLDNAYHQHVAIVGAGFTS